MWEIKDHVQTNSKGLRIRRGALHRKYSHPGCKGSRPVEGEYNGKRETEPRVKPDSSLQVYRDRPDVDDPFDGSEASVKDNNLVVVTILYTGNPRHLRRRRARAMRRAQRIARLR
jgi:hypothetical protein